MARSQPPGMLDFSQPVAIMLLLILHVIDDPYALTSRLVDAVVPGSYLAISIPASDIQPEAGAEATRSLNEGIRGQAASIR